jgi:hypothetical protein
MALAAHSIGGSGADDERQHTGGFIGYLGAYEQERLRYAIGSSITESGSGVPIGKELLEQPVGTDILGCAIR